MFSDGSAAVLVSRDTTKIQQKSLRILEQKQVHIYQGDRDMAWDINSEGFLMRLSSYVPELVNSKIKDLLLSLLGHQASFHEEIQHWAIHPGGRKILEVCQKELTLPGDSLASSYAVLRNYGNMSTPTILFVLKDMLRNSKLANSQRLFACGFGPGLTLEGALFEVSEYG